MIVYRFGPFKLERDTLLLCAGQLPLPLGPKVVETLLALVERPGEILGKTELLDRIWPEGYVEEANLAQNIYVIRKALRAHWPAVVIETVPRRGYRFVAEVRADACAERSPREPRAPLSIQRKRFTFAAVLAAVILAAVGTGVAQIASRSRLAHDPMAAFSSSEGRLYSMAQFYWNQRTPSGIAKSVRYFEAVARIDPRDARGYAGLASAYAIEGDYGFGPLDKESAFRKAAAYAERALAIDPSCAQAYAVLGLVAVDRKRMTQGVAEYRRAIALDPQYAPAHQWYGISLLLEGKTSAAFDELQTAANLDPESVATTDWLSQAAFIGRRYKDAIAYGRQTLDLSPQRYGVYQTIGMSYEALGDYRAAVAAYDRYAATCQSCKFDAAALLAHVYALTHENARAELQLKRAENGVASGRISLDNVVAALAALGRKDDALAMLRKAKSMEPPALLAVDPRLDALRGDARFREYTQGPG